nr:hypothetical protein [uncultured Sphingomonas sp.]
MTNRRLYLDLDGVMADFDAYFPQLFGVDHRDQADESMWAVINSHPAFFRTMPVCPGALQFFFAVEHLEPSILTACPKSDYANVARQKRGWVRQHLSTDITILPVQGGSAKPLFMNQPGTSSSMTSTATARLGKPQAGSRSTTLATSPRRSPASGTSSDGERHVP